MYKFRKGQRFGNWKVINPERKYFIKPSGSKVAKILCIDIRNNVTKYVLIFNLIHGLSKGSREMAYKLFGSAGHSTRYKFNSLPKNVYLYQPKGKQCKYPPFRVAKKVNGKTVTFGYYHDLKEATEKARSLDI